MINKNLAFVIVMLTMILTAIIFGKLGEMHTIREQVITQTEQGYIVEFEGNYYEYLE